MKEIIEKSKCCGCHACFNICPKGAISMKEDERGFKHPIINQDQCINCGMCERICPVANNQKEEEKEIKSFACYNNNLEERLNSSSGGIFILLAKEIIKRNGVVFGAAFDKDFNVKHTYAEEEKDLKQLMGSKYTQSTIGDTYKKAKEFLDNERYVLFSGTPCQIEGLKSYLKKEYDNLYTQDIICHGVPSPKVWRKYLDYQKRLNKETIESISFRNKDNGWEKFGMKISFKNNMYFKEHPKDLFMRAFLCNVCLRETCYNCSFKKKYRISDLTLADYWGINKIHPEMMDNNGVSLIVINSNKGKELFELIKDNIKFVETDLNEAIKYNPAMTNPVKHHKNEKAFLNDIDKLDFDQLIKKYVPKPSIIKRVYYKTKGIIKKIIKK